MKKRKSLFGIICLALMALSSESGAVYLEDFDSFTLGPLVGQGSWNDYSNTVEVVTNATGQALNFTSDEPVWLSHTNGGVDFAISGAEGGVEFGFDIRTQGVQTNTLSARMWLRQSSSSTMTPSFGVVGGVVAIRPAGDSGGVLYGSDLTSDEFYGAGTPEDPGYWESGDELQFKIIMTDVNYARATVTVSNLTRGVEIPTGFDNYYLGVNVESILPNMSRMFLRCDGSEGKIYVDNLYVMDYTNSIPPYVPYAPPIVLITNTVDGGNGQLEFPGVKDLTNGWQSSAGMVRYYTWQGTDQVGDTNYVDTVIPGWVVSNGGTIGLDSRSGTSNAGEDLDMAGNTYFFANPGHNGYLWHSEELPLYAGAVLNCSFWLKSNGSGSGALVDVRLGKELANIPSGSVKNIFRTFDVAGYYTASTGTVFNFEYIVTQDDIDDGFQYLTFKLTSRSGTQSYLDDVNLTMMAPYDSWAQTFGLGTNNAYADNPDGDSLNNLEEWALGGDPLLATDEGLPRMYEAGSSEFNYVYPSNALADNVEYTLGTKPDLINAGSWGSNYTVTGVSHVEGSMYYVTNAVPTAGEDSQFVQLEVNEAP